MTEPYKKTTKLMKDTPDEIIGIMNRLKNNIENYIGSYEIINEVDMESKFILYDELKTYRFRIEHDIERLNKMCW